jgi:hypothetical protein
MYSEQAGEDIFSKMTLFSLLKFKFTQIFLMGQNIFFSKMTHFFEKPVDNSVKPVDNSIKPAEFWVFKFFLFISRINFVSAKIFRVLPNF